MPDTHPYLAVEASYRWLDYREAYRDLLQQPLDARRCLAEVFVFRIWVAHYAWCRCARLGMPGEALTPATPAATAIPALWQLPRKVEDVPIESALGSPMDILLESRFALYDATAANNRDAADPHGLGAAASALARRLLGLAPPAHLVSDLSRRARGQYAGIAQACTTWNTLPPPGRPRPP